MSIDFYVYELVDPRTGDVRYIGVTSNPTERLRAHMRTTKRQPHVGAWVTELRALALEPVLRVVSSHESFDDAARAERNAIGRAAPSALLNVAPGGASGRPVVERALRKSRVLAVRLDSRGERLLNKLKKKLKAEESDVMRTALAHLHQHLGGKNPQ